jgi:hypothetical protein
MCNSWRNERGHKRTIRAGGISRKAYQEQGRSTTVTRAFPKPCEGSREHTSPNIQFFQRLHLFLPKPRRATTGPKTDGPTVAGPASTLYNCRACPFFALFVGQGYVHPVESGLVAMPDFFSSSFEAREGWTRYQRNRYLCYRLSALSRNACCPYRALLVVQYRPEKRDELSTKILAD